MFCPQCGTQNSESAKFCAVCGAPMTARPAQQPAASGAQPAAGPQSAAFGAQAPVASTAPTAPPASASASTPASFSAAIPASPAASAPLGPRTCVLVLGSALALVLMFQTWVSMPWLMNLVDALQAYASDTGSRMLSGMSADEFAVYIAPALEGFDVAYTVPALRTFASMLTSLADGLGGLLAAALVSSYGTSASSISAALSGVGAFGVFATVVFVLWAAAIVGILAGLALMFLRGDERLLLGGLAASALSALVCTVGVLVANGVLEGAFDQLMTSLSLMSSSASTATYYLDAVKPFFSPGFGAIATIACSAVTVVASLAMKKR